MHRNTHSNWHFHLIYWRYLFYWLVINTYIFAKASIGQLSPMRMDSIWIGMSDVLHTLRWETEIRLFVLIITKILAKWAWKNVPLVSPLRWLPSPRKKSVSNVNAKLYCKQIKITKLSSHILLTAHLKQFAMVELQASNIRSNWRKIKSRAKIGRRCSADSFALERRVTALREYGNGLSSGFCSIGYHTMLAPDANHNNNCSYFPLLSFVFLADDAEWTKLSISRDHKLAAAIQPKTVSKLLMVKRVSATVSPLTPYIPA